MTLDQGQEMTLALKLHIFIDSISCLHQATFKSQTAIVAKISIVFTISHVKSYFQNLPCHKIGQGYPRVIILANYMYDGLASPILHTKFHGNRPTGSGEDFCRIFTICGHCGHLGHVTKIRRTKFQFHYPKRLHKNFNLISQAVSKK